MLNCTMLQGRLTKAPELRHTQSGAAVCSFTLAVERSRKEQDGSRKADFIDCIAWGKTGEFVCQWFEKGQLMLVRGRLEGRDWEDKNGNKRRSWEVICEEARFCEGKGGKTQAVSIEKDGFTQLEDDSDVPF